MDTKEEKSLRQQIARLRKSVKDDLGEGVWGLKKRGDSFTHEEIVFLFARVFPVFGFEYIKKIRTEYPDCVCVKDGQEVSIEFEPMLSSFRDHIGKDDLKKCQYIVCWKDDLELHSTITKEIEENNIIVIQLKEFYEEGKVKSRKKSLDWSAKDFDKLKVNQLKTLYAFIDLDETILTTKEISNHTKIKGKALGGIFGGFTLMRKEWVIRRHPSGGWQFNQRFKQKIIDTVKKFGLT